MPRREIERVSAVLGLLRRAVERVSSVSRYDFVLAVLPLAFLLSVVAGTLLPVPPRDAFLAGSAVCLVALLDAMFLNPPRSATGA